MSNIDVIILGLIQGLTEFIPVSSSGHLILTAKLLGNHENTFYFDVLVNFGTLLALLVYFRKDLMQILLQWHKEKRLTEAIVISTIPAAIAGYYLQPLFELYTRPVWLVIVALAVVGAAMVFIDRYPTKKDKDLPPSRGEALAIGFAQSTALFPGVSRSGATIIGARLAKFNAERAARYSFLIAIPIIAGALVKVGISDGGFSYINGGLPTVVLGNVASALGGFFAIAFMLRILQRNGLKYFGYYRIALAFLISLLVITGVI